MSEPIKIVLFGPESTGKTFLAENLAKHFNTIYVPEFARVYLENKKKYYDYYSKGSEEICTQEDILPIVLGQMGLEDNMLPFAPKLIFYDTNPLQTQVYVKYYYKTEYEWLTKIIDDKTYDFYLLTNADIPWQPDPLRDKPHQREELFDLFKNELDVRKAKYFIISGNFEMRFKLAKRIMIQIMNHVHPK